MSTALFPPVDISIKLALSTGIGMLIGLEREWSQKDLGTRTFAITALAGTLSSLAEPASSYIAFAGILLILLLTGLRNIREGRPVETTTAAALIVTFILGVLVGEGHHYTPIAAAIVITMLLSFKPALTHFAGGLQVAEIRSAVLLGLLAFVIYPILPSRYVDPWRLVNPREAWLTVVVIAALGFGNYVLLKLYSSRGLYYTAVLGGMVNSSATIVELSRLIAGLKENLMPVMIIVDLLTMLAMFVRNLLILAIFARAAVPIAALSITVMALVSLAFLFGQRKHGASKIGELKLSSPFSLAKVLQFGAIFLIIQIVGTLGQRHLGHLGFLLVSVFGGFVSSASTVGAAAMLAIHGDITPQTAGLATALTSMTSALSNLPLLHQQIRNWVVTRRLTVLSAIVVGAGVLAMLVSMAFLAG
ncbi:MAG TPA: MgtC/SapB family protein [Bryobacteraceae bacterium]|nr:MgtC/SapB family protein [Bryobacteraceae bacterium]